MHQVWSVDAEKLRRFAASGEPSDDNLLRFETAAFVGQPPDGVGEVLERNRLKMRRETREAEVRKRKSCETVLRQAASKGHARGRPPAFGTAEQHHRGSRTTIGGEVGTHELAQHRAIISRESHLARVAHGLGRTGQYACVPGRRILSLVALVAMGLVLALGFALSASDSNGRNSRATATPAISVANDAALRSHPMVPASLGVCGAELQEALDARANLDQQPGYPGIQSAARATAHLLQRDCPADARGHAFWTDGLPQCATLEQSDPVCIGGEARGVRELPDVIGGCPSGPVTPTTDAGPSAALDAAVRYLTTVGEWRSAHVDLVYRVGTSDAGFGSVFAAQIPKWCGQAVADASYGVELTDTSGLWQGTDTHVGVVVAHLATGWQVWGAFH